MPTVTPPVVPPALVIPPKTPPSVYPKFSNATINIQGDSAKGQRTMRVNVPLCNVTNDQPAGQWTYAWTGAAYDTIQAAWNADKDVFQALCVAMGCPTMDLSTVPVNLAN